MYSRVENFTRDIAYLKKTKEKLARKLVQCLSIKDTAPTSSSLEGLRRDKPLSTRPKNPSMLVLHARVQTSVFMHLLLINLGKMVN